MVNTPEQQEPDWQVVDGNKSSTNTQSVETSFVALLQIMVLRCIASGAHPGMHPVGLRMHCPVTEQQVGLRPGKASGALQWAARSVRDLRPVCQMRTCAAGRTDPFLFLSLFLCLLHKKASASEPGAGGGAAAAGGSAVAVMDVSTSAVCEASEKCSFATQAGGSACASTAAGSSSNSNMPACLAAPWQHQTQARTNCMIDDR